MVSSPLAHCTLPVTNLIIALPVAVGCCLRSVVPSHNSEMPSISSCMGFGRAGSLQLASEGGGKGWCGAHRQGQGGPRQAHSRCPPPHPPCCCWRLQSANALPKLLMVGCTVDGCEMSIRMRGWRCRYNSVVHRHQDEPHGRQDHQQDASRPTGLLLRVLPLTMALHVAAPELHFALHDESAWQYGFELCVVMPRCADSAQCDRMAHS